MSLTLPPPGTMSRVLRHLEHMKPLQKNKPGGKFASKNSSFQQSNPAFVHPKDRISYWNILPGDTVQVKTGGRKVVDEATGKVTRIPWEGIVATIDRERNLVWLREGEDDKTGTKIPKNIKHFGSRIKDPEKEREGGGKGKEGEEEGPEAYTPSTVQVTRPIHYSNLRFRLPRDLNLPKDVGQELDLKEGVYATRLVRGSVRYNPRHGHFVWKRTAIVQAPSGTLKIEIPWKTSPDEGRSRRLKDHASVLEHVDQETWTPWNPSDPIRLLSAKQRSSEQSLARHEAALRQSKLDKRKHARDTAKTVSEEQILEYNYAGFTKRRGVKPPIMPQPPTASEQVLHNKKGLIEWLQKDHVQRHMDEGGKIFTAFDYLSLTPREGPSDGSWLSVSEEQASSAEAEEDREDGNSLVQQRRSLTTGQLTSKVAKEDIDSWPIEMLMTNDLTNPLGLRHRMRRWHRRQADKLAEAEALAAKDKMLVESFRQKIVAEQAEKKRLALAAEGREAAEQQQQQTIASSIGL